MSWIPPGIALLIGLTAIAYVIWPLIRNASHLPNGDEDAQLELLQRKDIALTAIQELAFDYQTGKLNEEDYARLNYQLRQQAITLLKQLEDNSPQATELEIELETAIAAERQIEADATASQTIDVNAAA